jgi:PAS domain S-box-containing protein
VVNNFQKEEQEVKNRLVDIVLLVASVIGLPLLVASFVRVVIFGNKPLLLLFIGLEAIFYAVLVIFYLCRKVIRFKIRAWFIIFSCFLFASLDFWSVGFISFGHIWLSTAIILSVLFFNFLNGIKSVVFSILIVVLFQVLKSTEILHYTLDYNLMAKAPVTMYVRTLMLLITCFTIIYSIKLIFETLNSKNLELQNKATDLVASTQQLKQEIEIRTKSEQQALENEYKFKNVFEKSSDPIAIISKVGILLDYNLSFLDLLGTTTDKISNIHYLALLPDDYKEEFKAYRNQLDLIPTRFEIIYRRNGMADKFLDVSLTPITFAADDAFMVVLRDNTEKISHERIVFTVALEAEEKERLRMSKELHDGLGPLLSTIKIYLDVLEKRPGDIEIQKRISNTLNESIRSVKEISNNLSPYVLQSFGVIKALKSFIDKITFNEKIHVSLASNIEKRLSKNIEITIYRLVTELLNNTLKHANAKLVDIQIILEDNLLSIVYTDNGDGFEMEMLKQNSHGIGLFNMKSRIENLGGKININTATGKGFKLFAQIVVTELD